MKPWTFNGKKIRSLEDLPEDAVGIIYKITNTETGKIYIGRKALSFKRRAKISQREKIQTGTRKRFKEIVKESDWSSYYGSCKELSQDIENMGYNLFTREIIDIAYSKLDLTYLEVKYQFLYNVLEIDSYNSNILNKFFRPKKKKI